MSSKYYKIVLDDLSNIEYYGTKANVNAAAHPQNFQSLEILYNIRYSKKEEVRFRKNMEQNTTYYNNMSAL